MEPSVDNARRPGRSLPPSPSKARTKVLATAAELFYERGVHAVGVNEIAARAHASKVSIYRYFPSKAELVERMLEEHSDRIHAWLERETVDSQPGVDRVLSIFDLLVEWFAEPGYRGCAVVNTVTDTRADPIIAAIARTHLARYRQLLESRLQEVGVSDPSRCANQLLLLIEGASVVATIDGGAHAGADARSAAEQLVMAARS